MLDRLRSFLHDAWPFVGAAYLSYLALRPPPVRYVGVGGLVVVTPLLLGWTVGRLFGVGPWADGTADGGQVAGGSGNETVDEGGAADDSGTPDADGSSTGAAAEGELKSSNDGEDKPTD